jgi:prepilin-type N-terminal cleavage/methylation domain-containing protein
LGDHVQTKNQFLGEIKMNHFEAKYSQAGLLRKSYSKGFTLLELLVVMVIIGLLVGYVAPKYFFSGRQV